MQHHTSQTRRHVNTIIHSYITVQHRDLERVVPYPLVFAAVSKNAVRTLEGRLLPFLYLSFRPSAFTTSAVTGNIEPTTSVFSSGIVFHVEGEVSVESCGLEYLDAYAFSLSSALQFEEVASEWLFLVLQYSGMEWWICHVILSSSSASCLSLVLSVSFRSVLTRWD